MRPRSSSPTVPMYFTRSPSRAHATSALATWPPGLRTSSVILTFPAYAGNFGTIKRVSVALSPTPTTSKSGIVVYRDSAALRALAEFADIHAGERGGNGAADQQRQRQHEKHHEREGFGRVAFDVEEPERQYAGYLKQADVAGCIRHHGGEAHDREHAAGHPKREIESVGVHQCPHRNHL